jgi:hypothetical protein
MEENHHLLVVACNTFFNMQMDPYGRERVDENSRTRAFPVWNKHLTAQNKKQRNPMPCNVSWIELIGQAL